MAVGGAPVAESSYFSANARCSALVGADGGGDTILAQGQIPDLVVGDMDSLTAQAREVIPPDRLHPIAEQDSTDFEKVLRVTEAPLVLAVGFTGGRLDHGLAALHALIRFCDRAVILLGGEDLIFHTPRHIDLILPPDSRLSLFPLGPVRVRGTGVKWPKAGLDIVMDPMTKIGTSNEVTKGQVALATDRPGLLTILPATSLDAAIGALDAADFHSPRPEPAAKGVTNLL
ncbi:thiamine diphosphokinase [Gymnodinialimonas sp. 2305UL16-5]|uniref:thiamine diphosphokinase n=1 Tax=Gymnodinialimonas mytili TaxID=3126503 RepID=UPI0030A6AC49